MVLQAEGSRSTILPRLGPAIATESVIWLISGPPIISAPPESPANTIPKIPARAAIKSFPQR